MLIAIVVVALVVVLASGVFELGGTEQPSTSPAQPRGTPAPADITGFNPAALYERSKRGVALVIATVGGGQALGSGFLATEEGHVITNQHVVVQGGTLANEVQVAFLRGEDDQVQLEAEIVGADATTDIAVLRVNMDELQADPLPLGNSSSVVIGEPVVAIGNPLGFSFSLTTGVVSGTGRNLRAPNDAIIPNGIQTDAAINQGNSGGPLINAAGEVIGVNEQIASETGGFSGLGFAVPIDTVRRVLEQLVEEGEVAHAFLGIEGQTITPALAELLELPAERGVLVARVSPGSAAEDAGLRGGDRQVDLGGNLFVLGGDMITGLDGESLLGMEELAARVAERRPGDELTLTLLRNGDEQRVTVTLGERPAQ